MTAKDMIKGKYYTFRRDKDMGDARFICKWQVCHMYPDNNYFYPDEWHDFRSGGREEAIDVKLATPEEIMWLNACVKAKHFVYVEEVKLINVYPIYL